MERAAFPQTEAAAAAHQQTPLVVPAVPRRPATSSHAGQRKGRLAPTGRGKLAQPLPLQRLHLQRLQSGQQAEELVVGRLSFQLQQAPAPSQQAPPELRAR